jgi:dihydroflavonol-4-reductase
MKVFVTGGNGFIGSRVVHQLCDQGHEVRCLLRDSSDRSRIEGLNYTTHIGDLRDKNSLAQGVSGCEGVIHLASISSWSAIRSPLMREVVVDGTRNLLQACAQAGKPRVVFVSSVTAIGATAGPAIQTEDSPFDLPVEPFVYAHAKRDAEALCKTAFEDDGLPVITINPCEVWGPQDDDFITAEYARDTLKDWPAMTVTGGTALAHVDDIAAGIVSALTMGRPGERYILGGDNVSAPELTRMILEAGGKPDKWVMKLPNSLTLKVIRAMAKLGLPVPVNPDLLAHAVLYWYVDCKKAQDELDYSWRPAKQTIEDLVGWLQEAGHV